MLAKYLKPVAIDSYINSKSKHDEGIVEAAVDEVVELYDIEHSVARVCIENVVNSDHDGFYWNGIS